MKVSIIIPNWNGEEKLRKNLPKVLKIKNVEEIIVVDDTSTDGSVSLIEQSFPEVKLIKKTKNEGFSSTVNLGVEKASGDLVFLLNTDAIAQENCLKFILPNFKDPKVFSVGLNSGGSWAWGKFEKGFFWHYQAEEKVAIVHQTLWVSGGSGVFRKSIWIELGGLDELFNPFYEEDVDLGYRATKRGYINLFEPKAVAEHYKEPGVITTNFSKSRIQMIASRNQLLFIWKNITSLWLIRSHLLNLFLMLISNPRYWSVFLSALAKLPKILKKRNLEKAKTKYRDEEVLSKFSNF
ncbi:glycosyltransferase family 2 protein [Candidatus Daviesbacteria bacterium]|nr:glycosyltransferase family 2 protein [Candidatus Daviesbacteria bacterium]